MRRNDREITNFEDILSIMEQCDVCRLALNDTDAPYILPLNFGMERKDKQIYLYFHGASEGRKYELLAQNNTVSFEMDCAHRLVTDVEKGHCTMEYKSVIGQGTVDIVTEDKEKAHALTRLMNHYHKVPVAYNPAAIPRTTVMRLTIQRMTAKARLVKE